MQQPDSQLGFWGKSSNDDKWKIEINSLHTETKYLSKDLTRVEERLTFVETKAETLLEKVDELYSLDKDFFHLARKHNQLRTDFETLENEVFSRIKNIEQMLGIQHSEVPPPQELPKEKRDEGHNQKEYDWPEDYETNPDYYSYSKMSSKRGGNTKGLVRKYLTPCSPKTSSRGSSTRKPTT